MTTIRYNPWTEINTLQRQFNRMFDDVVTTNNAQASGNYSRVPAAELTNTESALILKLELPGMNVADINIEAMAKSVSISGERKPETTDKTRTEFSYGKFARVIPLPARIQNTEVKADYKNGILYLNLPKVDEEKNKVVKVNLLAEADS